jgi:hypothetical protein
MTRRPILVVLALMAASVLAAGARADTMTSPSLTLGWHLVGLPALPVASDPYATFDPIPIAYRLFGYDPALRTYVMADPLHPDLLPAVISGEGYWLSVEDPASISYLGAPWAVGAVAPFSLGPRGWHLIGNPHAERVPLTSCVIGNGTTELPLGDAVAAGWIALPMFGWDPVSVGYQTVGLLGPPVEADTALTAWRGYWFCTDLDDLRLVVQRPLGAGAFDAWLVSQIGGMQQDYTFDLSLESLLTVVAAAPINATEVHAVFTGPTELVPGNTLDLFRSDSWPRQMPFGKGCFPTNPGPGQFDYTVTVEATTPAGSRSSIVLHLHVIGVEQPP